MAQQPPPAGDAPAPSVTEVTIPASGPAPGPAPAAPAARAAAQADWAAQLTDTIDQYVGLVRDRTTKPALVAARALVFGVILAILAVAAVVLVWIAWITGVTALVKKVWITYLITGGIFVVAGAFLMAKRKPPELEL